MIGVIPPLMTSGAEKRCAGSIRHFRRKDNIMGLFGIKISGNKVTVKRPAPQSPANIRPVTPQKGNNPAHTHANVPPSLAKKMTGGK